MILHWGEGQSSSRAGRGARALEREREDSERSEMSIRLLLACVVGGLVPFQTMSPRRVLWPLHIQGS
jgi:hypothetical protein